MKKFLAVAFAVVFACLPAAAQAEDLFYDDDSFESGLLLAPAAVPAVQFDAATAGGYTLDAVSFYLRAAAPGSYPVTVRFWDADLAELASAAFTVEYAAEGWYPLTLAAPVAFQGSLRVGIADAASLLTLGTDTNVPPAAHSHLFDGAGWSAVADADLGIRASVTLTAPAVGCVGFQPPLHRTVKMKKGARTLPLKAQLFDAAGAPLTDAGLTAAPVVTVLYAAAAGVPPVDVSAFVLPAGKSNAGAAFRFTDEGIWRYNLKTRGFVAAGFYTVSLASGDEASYVVAPTCSAEFVIGTPKQKKPKK